MHIRLGNIKRNNKLINPIIMNQTPILYENQTQKMASRPLMNVTVPKTDEALPL